LILSIKEIDKDRNGYVTNTELDDILKHHYPEALINMDLVSILSTFLSISNPILVAYKDLINWIRDSLYQREVDRQICKITKASDAASSQFKKSNSTLVNKIINKKLQKQNLGKI
jgi:hypothetical protein